jgi:hypothetical protein
MKIVLTFENEGLFKDAVTLNNYDDWTEFHVHLK